MRNSCSTPTILLSFICLFGVVAGMYLCNSHREDASVPDAEGEQLVALSVPTPHVVAPPKQIGRPLPEDEQADAEQALHLVVPEGVAVQADAPLLSEENPVATSLAAMPPDLPARSEEPVPVIPPVPPVVPTDPAKGAVPSVTPSRAKPRQVISGVVAKGDSAARLLSAHISEDSVQELLSATKNVHSLTQIHIGQPYTLVRAPESKDMERFEYEIDATKRLVVKRTASGLEARIEPVPYVYALARVSGTIHSSLFESLASAGEAPILAVSIAEIFGSEINFIKDLRKGDTFSLLIEKRYREHTFTRYGKILGATFTNQGKTYEGYLFAAEHGLEAYYNAKGESLKKTLLKAPLSFTRISSGYSLSRKHPVFFDRRPHQGVDYAAPSGTPVKAVGDGVVAKSGWGNGFGNMVIINHVGGLESMYAHLSGFARGLKRGQRVKQGQVVGYVGATGIATGPHLDFRLKQHGRYVNPTKVVNPRGGPVPRKAQAAFKNHKNLVQAYLNGTKALSEYVRK